MRILVTGATGFIGTHVIEELILRGFEVIATSTDIFKAKSFDWYKKVEFISYSIGRLSGDEDLFKYFNEPDLLIHLAWQGLPNYKALYHIDKNLFEQFSFLKNILGNGLKNITIAGTCLEYGMQSGALKEDLISEPSNSYALAKDCLRRFIVETQKVYSFKFKWLRLFYMYGEGQSPNSLIPLLERAIENSESEFNMTGGEQLRDYLPVAEVARNIIYAAIQTEITGIINCCSGQPISVKQLVNKFVKDRNSNIKLNLGYYPYPDYEPMEFWGDKTKFNKILSNSCTSKIISPVPGTTPH